MKSLRSGFDNVEVNESDILGELHEGFRVMITTLNGGRLFVAGLALGSLASALDTVRKYVQERVQFDDRPRTGAHGAHRACWNACGGS